MFLIFFFRMVRTVIHLPEILKMGEKKDDSHGRAAHMNLFTTGTAYRLL
jgi:hypothetical protein